ncbi:hypothetical protein HC030_22300, partial [Planosporangium mesophilum]|uniref:hypothetical protein n=1 Tax=Planosporangium mesophilum TaxID=689768 RepID=UPI0016B4CE75
MNGQNDLVTNDGRLPQAQLQRAARRLWWGGLLAVLVRGIAWMLTLGSFGPILGAASGLFYKVPSGDVLVLIEAAVAVSGVPAALVCAVGLAYGKRWAVQAGRGLAWCFLVDAIFIVGGSGWFLAVAASELTKLQWVAVAVLLGGQLVLLWWAVVLVRWLGAVPAHTRGPGRYSSEVQQPTALNQTTRDLNEPSDLTRDVKESPTSLARWRTSSRSSRTA